MFSPDRVFPQINSQTGKVEWFFQAREGNIGPYDTKERAQGMLQEFIDRCMKTHNDGGRSRDPASSLSISPLEDDTAFKFDPLKRKRGSDD